MSGLARNVTPLLRNLLVDETSALLSAVDEIQRKVIVAKILGHFTDLDIYAWQEELATLGELMTVFDREERSLIARYRFHG